MLRTYVPLCFYLLVLQGWMGNNISLFCEMRVWALSHYGGHFFIWTSNPNFNGFLWLICLHVQWVLFLLIFINVGFLGFLPHFACHLVLLGFIFIVLVIDLDSQLNINSSTFVFLRFHWDVCNIPYSRFCIRLSVLWFVLSLCLGFATSFRFV